MNLFIRVLALLSLIFVLSNCSRVTPDNFKKIQKGMSSEDVKMILGEPDQQDLQAFSGLTGSTYIYHHGKSTVKIIFVNDKVAATNGQFNP